MIARVGHYSKLVDLTLSSNVTSITFSTASGSSLLASAVTYRAASSTGVFGSSGTTNSVSGSNGCLGNVAGVRYVWVSITLDGSYGATGGGVFPDVAGVTAGSGVVNANATDFTVNYNATHAAPSTRLRGGKTLQSGSLGVLDTCGA